MMPKGNIVRVSLLLTALFSQTARADRLTPCDLPAGSVVDTRFQQGVLCGPSMDVSETNRCLSDLQRVARDGAANQDALEAQAKCLCEVLAKVMGSTKLGPPYSELTHTCEFYTP